MINLLKTIQSFSVAIAIGGAQASAVLPLDTFPDVGDIVGPTYPVYASFEWQEIAIPFHIAVGGTVTRIDTGLYYSSGSTPLLFGVASGQLVGQAFPNAILEEAICGTYVEPGAPNYCRNNAANYGYSDPATLDPGEQFSWTGRLFLQAGDYLLYASLRGDDVFGGWSSNGSLLTDNWAARGCALSFAQGQGCLWATSTWASVSQYGPQLGFGSAIGAGGSYATPVARIFFEPGLRVPEPATLALVSVALVSLAATRRRTREETREPTLRGRRLESSSTDCGSQPAATSHGR